MKERVVAKEFVVNWRSTWCGLYEMRSSLDNCVDVLIGIFLELQGNCKEAFMLTVPSICL